MKCKIISRLALRTIILFLFHHMRRMFKISNKALNILVDKRQTQASREIRVTQKTQATGKTKETRKTVLIGLTDLKVLTNL